MHRSASPALSENEVDISRSLFKHGAGDFSDSEAGEEEVDHARLSHDGIQIGESDDEGDEAFIAAAQADVNRKSDNKTAKKAGAFQSMGLNTHLLKAIARKGFTVPTPIQRKTIPMIMDGQDVVGMARTGSGKTAAFIIPMIEKLKSHSAKVGARGIVLSPSRELALQTLKVVKELSKGTDLRTTLLVGGDSLEEQFSSMASNPDIIIATPGRFEHLKVEMGLDLSSVRYIVFDEADRLFEMGFAAQLTEIVYGLPSSRQTLLFSATLPKSLVEFARAGLQDPKLIRLDAESKIAPGLESAFFTVKRAEKEGALMHILQDIIKMPVGSTAADKKSKEPTNNSSKKRKRGVDGSAPRETPSPHSTVVFAATKHHVDYLANLLKGLGYATSYVYGSLDQTARKMQVHDFRTGMTNILVVTDVAARGLDIPVLANVINYDFPSQPKIFVHRVGRTARAGKTGWSYSLITGQDMPYLLDLQLFLSKKLVLGRIRKEDGMFKDSVVVGTMLRDRLERCCEEVAKLVDEDGDLAGMREVAGKGEKQFLRTRNAASAESVKRAKQLGQTENSKGTSMLFEPDEDGHDEQARLDMLARVSGFRPQETVFEIGKRGKPSEAADVVKKRRAKMEPKHRPETALEEGGQTLPNQPDDATPTSDGAPQPLDVESDEELVLTQPGADMDEASEDELELTFTKPNSAAPKSAGKGGWHDSEHFMAYTPTTLNLAEDRGYGVQSGSNSNFVEAAKGATMDLTNDESKAFAEPSRSTGLRWDKKSKKYVSKANDEDGSKGAKMIRGESGQKIAASFRSGRFDAWRKANKVDRLPRVGEMERSGAHFASNGGKRFKHKMEKAPKEADKYRDDYYKRKKKVDEAKEKRIGRFAEGKGKSELRGVDDVRKERRLKTKRRDKNARPSRKM
ncbi:ATP-dependent RNA helicase dbp10 [Vermiconidia calcicola]|uniref:ATP-dependent RNA helicase dbp10 n=1 Tax=Vermiconidia calcicola TaxID=1690605 RepID=A0ACC3N9A5_9PEZI|nr:ATP-dependent RNA helicase dbp10 [Vermiconidia calcicola]